MDLSGSYDTITGWRPAIPVCASPEDFLERQTFAAPVRHLVGRDGVGQLAYEVHEGLGCSLQKGDVARSAAGGGDQWRRGRERERLLVDGPHAD